MAPKKGDPKRSEHDGASAGKIFVGGLPKETSMATFMKHFEKYGEIIDSVIMKDRHTQRPRGFGFITYADPSVVDNVIEDTHVINDKQVEIKRTIPKSSAPSKDVRTKKIFVGGIPTTVTEDELKNFFSKYGKVVEHEIIRDHATKRSRGFGFIIFDGEQAVDDLLAKGNMIDLAGSQVEIKKAEPKKASNPPAPVYGSEPRRPFDDSFGRYGSSYSGYGVGGGFGPSTYRTTGALGPRLGDYDGYVGSGYAGSSSALGGYRGETPLNYTDRLGQYSGGYVGGLGYGCDEGFGAYGSAGYGIGNETGPGTGYGSVYGRGGYGSGAGRYHPYAR